MLYICYIHIIYQVYSRYIPGIFQSYAVLTNMPGIYLLHNKWVCSVPFFIIISLWYTMYIIIKKGTEQTHLLWSGYIPGILVRTAYDLNIPGIYTWFIPCISRKVSHIPVIYQEYSWNMLYGISFAYTCIYRVYK